jgi:aldose 1-epimerase
MLRSFGLFLAALAPLHAAVTVTSAPFGMIEGRAVDLYTLSNSSGMKVTIATLGGIVTSLSAPDRSGASANIVLGFDTLAGYTPNPPYLGAIIGRYANRIAKGTFTLDGKTFHIPANNGSNALHGGPIGFNRAIWTASILNGVALLLTHISPDGDQGFPGTLRASVVYSLGDDNTFRIDYSATTDRPTVVNLTNHAYFNLAGAGSGPVLDHQVVIHASRYSPTDAASIPLGDPVSVRGTPFDFLAAHTIGERINAADPQLQAAKGYDHNFVLDAKPGTLALAAEVYDPKSGRVLQVLTTEPGVQFYTANGLNQGPYRPRTAFCLETEHFPDSPNHPSFPSTTLRPGMTYRSTTVWKFSTRK